MPHVRSFDLRMAHMHNFAATRALVWERLDEFVTHVTRGAARP